MKKNHLAPNLGPKYDPKRFFGPYLGKNQGIGGTGNGGVRLNGGDGVGGWGVNGQFLVTGVVYQPLEVPL